MFLLLLLSSVAFAAPKAEELAPSATPSEATAAKPLRLARVPLIVRSTYADRAAVERLEDRLDLALHVPLNDTMHYVEEIPQSDVEDALDDVLADLSQEKKRVRMKDAMPELAERLDADLVICPVLTDYREFIFYGGGGWGWDFDGDTMRLESYVALELDGYDRAEGKNFSKSTSRFYHDSYRSMGRASYLAQEALESLIQETDINKRIMRPVKERAAS